jgi:predicted nuclease of restriction endonuclease-like (RecB) superfamily
MNFEKLINQIEQTHGSLQKKALTALNINLTLRNWIIGFYIVEFEQQGSDRAAYGKRLLSKMAERLKHIRGLSHRNLKTFRAFYLCYPQIAELFIENTEFSFVKDLKSTISDVLQNKNTIGQTPSAQFKSGKNTIGQLSTAQFKNDENSIGQTPSAQFQKPDNKLFIPPLRLITNLSFSHLIEIIRINDPLKRVFYEIEAIKGNWSVRELQRQINTLLFERTGLSNNKDELIRIANRNAETQNVENIIRQPYFFEFAGFTDKDIVTETDLENALLNHLQEFLLELGEGFCFEARQKRITIGNKYYRIDLVFYHRILKCHVLIELKLNEVDYTAITQLNTYVSYYRKNKMQSDDKPTIGILMCTNKDEAFVEFALAGLDEKIFISQYLLHIPTKEKLEKFIEQEIRKH